MIAAITASELLQGVFRAAPGVRRDRRAAFVARVLATVPVMPFDLMVARVHAFVWSYVLSVGTPIGHHDLLIAATALAHGHGVLADNLREFQRVPGLTVVQPAWPT